MAKKAETTEIANYDAELAALAGKGASLAPAGGGGRFFSTKAGVLAFDDVPLPGNQMAVIIVAWCLENVYYDSEYDADNRTPPACFAFCKDPEAADEMGPPAIVEEDDAFTKQNDLCDGCWANEFGSAAKGKGKACSNRRRLGMIPAGTYVSQGKGKGYELDLFEDPDHFKSAEEAFLKVPVMSGKGFDAYVKEVAEQLKKPLFAVITNVSLEPDAKSQFRVNFELIEEVDASLIPVLLPRYKRMIDEIDFPYRPPSDDDDNAGDSTSARTAKPAFKKLTTKGRAKK